MRFILEMIIFRFDTYEHGAGSNLQTEFGNHFRSKRTLDKQLADDVFQKTSSEARPTHHHHQRLSSPDMASPMDQSN